MLVVHLSAVVGVVGALVCAGRPDLGFGVALPVFAVALLVIAIDAIRHVGRPVARGGVATR